MAVYEANPDSRIRTWTGRVGVVPGLMVLVASLLALGSALWWPLALLEHFRLWYAVLLLPFAILTAFHNRYLAVLFLVGAVANAVPVGRHVRWQASPPTGTHCHIISANLDHHASPNAPAIHTLLASYPDLLLLFEVTPDWLEVIEKASPGYDVLESVARVDTRGVAALTRSGGLLAAVTVIQLLPEITDRPMLVVDMPRDDGRIVRVLGFHSKRPVGAQNSRIQGLEFEALGDWLESQRNGPPILVMGDFNATPWSYRCRRLVDDSGYRSTKRDWPMGTWPALAPMAAQLPIDHCIADPSLDIAVCRPGRRIGSDHLPLVVSVR